MGLSLGKEIIFLFLFWRIPPPDGSKTTFPLGLPCGARSAASSFSQWQWSGPVLVPVSISVVIS